MQNIGSQENANARIGNDGDPTGGHGSKHKRKAHESSSDLCVLHNGEAVFRSKPILARILVSSASIFLVFFRTSSSSSILLRAFVPMRWASSWSLSSRRMAEERRSPSIQV